MGRGQPPQIPAVGNLSELLSAPVSDGDTGSFLSRAANTGISADGTAGSPAQPDASRSCTFPQESRVFRGPSPTPNRFVPHNSWVTRGGEVVGRLPGKGCQHPAQTNCFWKDQQNKQPRGQPPRRAAAPRSAGRGQDVPASSRCPRVTPPPPAPRLIKGPRGSFLREAERPFPGEPSLSTLGPIIYI